MHLLSLSSLERERRGWSTRQGSLSCASRVGRMATRVASGRRWVSFVSELAASSLVRPAARAHPVFCPTFIPVAVRERTSRFMRRRVAVRRRRSAARALRGQDWPQQATTALQAAFQDMPARLASVHWLSALMDSAHPPRSRQAA